MQRQSLDTRAILVSLPFSKICASCHNFQCRLFSVLVEKGTSQLVRHGCKENYKVYTIFLVVNNWFCRLHRNLMNSGLWTSIRSMSSFYRLKWNRFKILICSISDGLVIFNQRKHLLLHIWLVNWRTERWRINYQDCVKSCSEWACFPQVRTDSWRRVSNSWMKSCLSHSLCTGY